MEAEASRARSEGDSAMPRVRGRGGRFGGKGGVDGGGEAGAPLEGTEGAVMKLGSAPESSVEMDMAVSVAGTSGEWTAYINEQTLVKA